MQRSKSDISGNMIHVEFLQNSEGDKKGEKLLNLNMF